MKPMSKGGNVRRRLLVFYLAIVHAALIFFGVSYFLPYFTSTHLKAVQDVAPPLPSSTVPSPLPNPSDFVSPTPAVEMATPSDQPADSLCIPVKGIKRSDLVDTFAAARANGGIHDAIDIMAPGGTPVLAAADGQIIKFFDSVAGGTTIYQASSDQKYIYYYAHLQRRAEGLQENQFVRRCQLIAYVGDTGNAGPGNFHLHFAVAISSDPKRYWEGTYIDPFPILKNGIEAP
jgi:murein DD-endopeptidase MepM/ murein hydrolase activator NlpD